MGQEGAEALAELAFEDVRVPVAVRAEWGGAVVDVQCTQAVEADRLVDLCHERVDESGSVTSYPDAYR